MPEVSIILPSLRPTAVLQRIKEFSITNRDSDYEIVVVSPFTIKEDRVVHIYEEEQLGSTFANNTAYENSSGEYIVWWADDVYPTTNCLSNMLRFVKSKRDPFIGSFRLRRGGREKSQWIVYGKLYACLGCASRNTLKLIGGFFDPIFKHYWVDPDMCLRTWEKGGRVEICPDAWVEDENIIDEVRENSWNKYFATDTQTFLNRWHDTLGRGIEKDWRNWRIINKTLLAPAWYYHISDFLPSFMRPASIRLYRALRSKLSFIPYLRIM